MGCDIHFFAEKRNKETGKWEFLPAPATEGYMPGDEVKDENGKTKGWPYRWGVVDTSDPKFVPGYDNRYCDEDEPSPLRDWFDDRNYRLFGMLADVRNGSGFAGCDTGDAVEPVLPASVMSEDGVPHTRGWPNDASPEIEKEREQIEHTPSWLTVAEILAYLDRKRSQDTVERGYITGAQYEELRDNGTRPASWSGGISGRDIITVAASIYDMIPVDKIKHEVAEDGFDSVITKVAYMDLPEGVCNQRKEDIQSAQSYQALLGRSVVAPPEEFARVYVKAEWHKPHSDHTRRFEYCLQEMMAAAGNPDPIDVRVVFYFDS